MILDCFTIVCGELQVTHDRANFEPGMGARGYLGIRTSLKGYLHDPNNILPGKAAAAVVPVGSGFVVLLGFRALERAEADATFMMYFDAIYYSTAVNTTLP